ncbi:MAG: peptide ABC transporter permease [Hyphomicrobiales bacterium]
MTQIEIKPPKTRSGRPVVPTRPRGTPGDAAADAAGFLRRLGFAAMVGLLPIAAVIMRHAVVGIAPVGAILFSMAMLIESEGRQPFGRMWRLLKTPAAATLLFLIVWAGLSLLWTPFFDDASERLLKAIGVGLCAFAALGSVPERMRASNLYLVPLGAGIGALSAIVWVLTVPNAQTAIDGDGPVLVRTALSVTLLAWPGLAWLLMRSERASAIALAVAIVGAALLSGSRPAILALLAGGVGFGLCAVAPRLTIPAAKWLLALIIVAAPALPFLALALARAFVGIDAAALQPLEIWRDCVLGEPVRLLTGHGLDTALRSQLAGLLPLGAPQSILFEVWYELGLLGAAALALLTAFATRSAAQLGEAIAPCLIGAIVNLFAFACLGLVGSQTWWLTLIAVLSIAFTAVIHGRFGTRRPKAFLNR